MTQPTEGYTYCFNGRDGTFDLIEILNPEGKPVASLYYWDEPDTDEAVRVEGSARLICQHLNRWWFSGECVDVVVASPPAEATPKERVNNREHSPNPWSYQYSPYTITSDASPLGVGAELPAYEVFDAEGNKVFDSNEDTPADLQEANARLGACAPRLLQALVTCANLLADYDESDGEEGEAYREAVAAIHESTGRPE